MRLSKKQATAAEASLQPPQRASPRGCCPHPVLRMPQQLHCSLLVAASAGSNLSVAAKQACEHFQLHQRCQSRFRGSCCPHRLQLLQCLVQTVEQGTPPLWQVSLRQLKLQAQRMKQEELSQQQHLQQRAPT